jgi:hypothetical protein
MRRLPDAIQQQVFGGIDLEPQLLAILAQEAEVLAKRSHLPGRERFFYILSF